MARKLNKLSATQVNKLKTVEGYHGDGGGLWLQGGRSQSWIFRYTRGGKTRDIGLGGVRDRTLAEAREKAAQYRKFLLDGIDPHEVRGAEKLQRALDEAKTFLFKACAESYIKAHRAGWKNEKHAEQWTNTLSTYAYPVFGALPVQAVDTGLVLKVLEPIWTTKHETATRVRSRIERVLDWATTREYRKGDNPARWRGHLESQLARIEKKKRVKHHAALPFNEIAEFLVSLRAQEGVGARALEFVILTACRTGEAIGARWSEIDLDAGTWEIPAERMKAHRKHRIPLSPRAVTLLKGMLPLRQPGDYVFPASKVGRPMSNMVMLELLKRMERDDITVHGFRSSFRDWTSERTNYPREVCEMALAHTIGNATEEAYLRGDLFDKRRRLMNDWARWCGKPPQSSDVLPLRPQRA
jgi:integrase